MPECTLSVIASRVAQLHTRCLALRSNPKVLPLDVPDCFEAYTLTMTASCITIEFESGRFGRNLRRRLVCCRHGLLQLHRLEWLPLAVQDHDIPALAREDPRLGDDHEPALAL